MKVKHINIHTSHSDLVSTSSLCRALNPIVEDLKPNIQLYVDDMLVLTETLEEHMIILRKLFQKFKEYNITVNFGKSEFFKQKLNYVGFVLTPEGVMPQPEKIDLIHSFPIPKNKKHLKSFLGLCGYYQKFSSSYSEKVSKLRHLLKEKRKWEWSQKDTNNFEEIKKVFTDQILIHHPNFNETFILQTDASDYALGAQLFQEINGEIKVIQYASCMLQDREVKLRILVAYASIRHPQSNKTERTNRDLGEYFRVLLKEKKHTLWIKYLPLIEFLINNTYHQGVDGYPIRIHCGRDTVCLFENVIGQYVVNTNSQLDEEQIAALWDATHNRIIKKGEEARSKFDANHQIQELEVGDLVLVASLRIPNGRNEASKFLPFWEGPFYIQTKHSASAYTVARLDHTVRGKFHISSLKKFHDPMSG